MGCGSSKIAGDPSVGTDNNQHAKPRKSWLPKIEMPPAEGQMLDHHSIDYNRNTDPKMSNKKKLSAFVGTPDQYFKNRGASAAGGPITSGPNIGTL
jgi:hypothetical protein